MASQAVDTTEATGTTDTTSTTDVIEQTEVTTTGTADGGSANVTKETETVTQTVSAGEEGATVVIEKDTEIVESTTEAPHEDAEADEKLQTSTISIKDDNLDAKPLTLEGPLTKSELISKATEEDQLFVIRFPKLDNQTAFLDTPAYTLHFRDESIITSNRSILMCFERSDDQTGEKLKWTTLVMSHRYLTVTSSQLQGPEVMRRLVFEEHVDKDDIPLWIVEGNGQQLTFLNEEADEKWFSHPVENESIGRQVVGVENPDDFSFNVYHVIGENAKTIPIINIVP